jgi:hypothetical protein
MAPTRATGCYSAVKTDGNGPIYPRDFPELLTLAKRYEGGDYRRGANLETSDYRLLRLCALCLPEFHGRPQCSAEQANWENRHRRWIFQMLRGDLLFFQRGEKLAMWASIGNGKTIHTSSPQWHFVTTLNQHITTRLLCEKGVPGKLSDT